VKPSDDHRASLERFVRMGLGGNPFRVVPPGEVASLYEPLAPSRGPRADGIAASSARFVQIIGAEGRGKSTLLSAIQPLLEEQGLTCERRFLPPDHDGRFDAPRDAAAVLLIDEAQRLRRKSRLAARSWLEVGDRRLIVTTHEDLHRTFGDESETVELPDADAEIVDRVFRRRIVTSGGDADLIRLTPGAARWLAQASGGSLRWVERFCYELFQHIEASPRILIDERSLRRAQRHV